MSTIETDIQPLISQFSERLFGVQLGLSGCRKDVEAALILFCVSPTVTDRVAKSVGGISGEKASVANVDLYIAR